MNNNEAYNPFEAETISNSPDTPVEEMKDTSDNSLDDIAEHIEKRLELSKSKEGNIVRISLVCPEELLPEIITSLKEKLQITGATIEFHAENTREFYDIYQQEIQQTADQINTEPCSRSMIVVTGVENAITDDELVYRGVHDFFQALADSQAFRDWVSVLEDDKQVFVVLALTYNQNLEEDEATSKANRSIANSQFTDEKIMFLKD